MGRVKVPQATVRWTKAWRIVPSLFPPVSLFDRVADGRDLEAVLAIEGMTNPRLRQEAGDISLVPTARRISGPGSTPVMAAFTHLVPSGSRFTDGSFGIFYAGHSLETATRETVFHRERFLRDGQVGAIDLDMRCYRTAIRAQLCDLRRGFEQEHDPDSYVASQRLGFELRHQGRNGLVYRSVRHPGGECVAAFFPDVVAPCVQAGHLIYRWDGNRIAAVLEVSRASDRRPVDG